MKLGSQHMRLYVVTDQTWLGENSLVDQVEEAIKAGATFVQLREKELSFDEFVLQAKEMKKVTDQYKIPFVINDDIEVAIVADADGVHVGQSDRSALDVRALIGPSKILGVSAQTVEQAQFAEKCGADYIGVGAVFTTSTKLDADYVPYDTLQAICKSVTIPVVAIGGIHEGNLLELKGSGVDGVAVISAIFAQPDIYGATRNLRKLSDQMVRTEVKGVIFDLDGTLLDSMTMWKQVGALFLQSQGVVPPDNLDEILKGMSFKESSEYIRNTFDIVLTQEEIIHHFNEIAETQYINSIQLKPYVKEFMSQLKEKQVKLCIVTETDPPLVKAVLARFGLLEYFEFILTGSEVGKGKNHPDIYHQATDRLVCEQNEVVIFEDALYAIRCAKAAGYFVIGVFDEAARSDQEEITSMCDQTINSFKEMIK